MIGVSRPYKMEGQLLNCNYNVKHNDNPPAFITLTKKLHDININGNQE